MDVLILKLEQNKVIVNMVNLNFETFPKMTVQDGLTPVPKARFDIVNLIAEKQQATSLILMMIKFEEIM